MKYLKAAFITVLMTVVAMATLQVSLVSNAEQIVADSNGLAQFQFRTYASGSSEGVHFNVSTTAGYSLADQDANYQLGVNGVRYVTIYVNTPSSAYNGQEFPVTVTVRGDTSTYTFAGLNVKALYDGSDPVTTPEDFQFKGDYRDVTVRQGEFQYLKFMLKNNGNTALKNILISGDISERFNPEYPSNGFTLYAHESKEITVKVTVPQDYPEGMYTMRLTAASGSNEATAEMDLYVAKRIEYVGKLDVKLVGLNKVIVDGQTTGYELIVRLKNMGTTDLNNVKASIQGIPSSWEILGDTSADVRSFEVKDITLRAMTTDFSQHQATVVVSKDNQELGSVAVTLSADTAQGDAGSSGTGFFFAGGSFLFGLLVIAVLALVLLYVRQRNKHEDDVEDVRTKNYLERLVDEAKRDAQKDDTLRREL